MTEPEVDIAVRLANNLDAFMNVHKAEIILMADVLKLDVDLLLMEYVMSGYNAVKGICMEALERDGKDYIVKLAEYKAMIRAKEAADAAQEGEA